MQASAGAEEEALRALEKFWYVLAKEPSVRLETTFRGAEGKTRIDEVTASERARLPHGGSAQL